VGGQRPAPTGRMPGESPATVIHGRGDSACMAVEGLNSGNSEHTKIQQKRKG